MHEKAIAAVGELQKACLRSGHTQYMERLDVIREHLLSLENQPEEKSLVQRFMSKFVRSNDDEPTGVGA
jgi:hypothetical protein